MRRMKSKTVFCSFILTCSIACLSCASTKKTEVRIDDKKIKTSEFVIDFPDSFFQVKSFTVTPQERENSGGLFRHIGTVKLINDTWYYGGAIDYELKFELIIDSSKVCKFCGYQLEEIKILKKLSHRVDRENGTDSIFVFPQFRRVQKEDGIKAGMRGKISLRHYSSTRKSSLVFIMGEQTSIVKTQFRKPFTY
jgi:hypothetical protein